MLLNRTGLCFPRRRLVFTPTTWNPSDKGASSTLSNGNLTNTTTSGGFGSVRSIASMAANSGKYFWEVSVDTVGAAAVVSIGDGVASVAGSLNVAGFWNYTSTAGNFQIGGSVSSAYGASFTSGDVIGVSYNSYTGDVHFYKNGVDQGLAITLTPASGPYFAACADGSSSGAAAVFTANFGATPFAFESRIGYQRGLGS